MKIKRWEDGKMARRRMWDKRKKTVKKRLRKRLKKNLKEGEKDGVGESGWKGVGRRRKASWKPSCIIPVRWRRKLKNVNFL